MFDRFIRLARARKALQENRFEDALQLADDPVIRSTRRADEVRDRARDRLLERARQRLADGDLRAARGLIQRLRALANNGAVEDLAQSLETGEERRREAADAARRGLDEARKLMAKGQIAAATAAVSALPPGSMSDEQKQLEQQLADRTRQAEKFLDLVAEQLGQGAVVEARQAFARALALDGDVALAATVRPRLIEAALHDVGRRILARVEADDLAGAFHELRCALSEVEVDASHAALRQPLARLETALMAKLRQGEDLPAACALSELAHDSGVVMSDAVGSLLAALRRVSGGAGSPAALDQLAEVAGRAGARGLAAAAGKAAAREGDFAARLVAAREAIDSANLDLAREQLVQLLAEEPMHEAARRELELVEQGITELAQRLESARAAAKAGKLREACAAAMAIGSTGRLGAEAQLLLTDLRARMALVDRGLDEVRATLHGRAASSVRGVRHCLGRLEELAKVQLDHDELRRAIAAVTAEIEGLEACDRAALALGDGEVGAAASALDEVLTRRLRLLSPERLDARVLALGDRFQQSGEQALVAGRGVDLEACAGVLERLGAIRAEFAAIAARLRREASGRLASADGRVAEARACLARRELADAERLLEEAAELWREAPSVRELGFQLASVRKQSAAIAEVEALARGQDYRGAAEKVAAMPPTPALLRTRIFDMKQQLAKAQGLEGAFLMRVDEGGEHLVLRGESVSIGNMRQSCADLPVLANIAGKHASIRRRMSFHGGMEDEVVAEDGEVQVGGVPVRRHRLVSGDRIQFGASLAAVYQRPTSRSLTVGLVLQGGFQVAGTDRVILMKDRGRDGRILLGPSRDVHVHVGSAAAEVEVFAAGTGQMRVACAAGGTIDGAPFKGEHPVDAGQLVVAGGITFVLLPWRPA